MLEIRFVQSKDKEFWYSLDKHLPKQEFDHKVRDKRGYVLLDDNKPIGLLRYNLFGIIPLFVQCYLLNGIIKEKVMGKNLWSIGKLI